MYTCVRLVHKYIQYLKLLSALSKVFQGNHHTIETVVAKIEAVKSKLEQLSSNKAKLEQVISKDLAVNESVIYMFQRTLLTMRVTPEKQGVMVQLWQQMPLECKKKFQELLTKPYRTLLRDLATH